jgi:predicted DNA-binding transcriptional regulator AlpA
MGRARRQIQCPRDPVGLSSAEAAALLGVSESLFCRAVQTGLMPRPRELFGRLLFDAEEVIAAYRRLPRRGDTGESGGAGDQWGDVAV